MAPWPNSFSCEAQEKWSDPSCDHATMRTVAIDASRAASEQKTGVGWYCYHLLAHLKEVIPHDVRVVLYSDQRLPEALRPWPAHWEERVLRWPPRISNPRLQTSGVRWPLWSQVRLTWQAVRDRPDVLFVPAHVIPEMLAWRRRWSVRTKLVTVVHDVAFQEFPEVYSSRERWYADHATLLAV